MRAFLVQPFIEDHPAFNSDPSIKAATLVRVITVKMTPTSAAKIIHTQLEKPRQEPLFYNKIPLHWESLDVDPIFQTRFPLRQKEVPSLSNALKELIRESQDFCLKAHQHLLNLNSVAFDVIISEQGPFLLEANFNWHIAPLYQVLPFSHLMEESDHPAGQWLRHVLYS